MPSASIANLEFRAKVLREIRHFFDSQNFLEVQTPILSADCVIDEFLELFVLSDPQLPVNHHGDRRYFLQTSPEFAMKRLLQAGMKAIYQITPVFRKGDRGRQHNPEFTMLEWYQASDALHPANPYQAGQEFLASLVRHLTGRGVQFFTFFEVFQQYVHCDPHRASAAQLREIAKSRQISWPASFADNPAEWLDLLFSELIQPHLDAVIVRDFPASQSQLAQIRTGDSNFGSEIAVSERFELFLGGVELANGYHELLDAAELRQRFQQTAMKRIAAGKAAIPVESRLLEAMQKGLPSCSGCALGIDRLLMVLLKTQNIDDVLAFPLERA